MNNERKRISIIGFGKLGICLGLNLFKNGYNVLGIDKNIEYVESINKGLISSSEPYISQMINSAFELQNKFSYKTCTQSLLPIKERTFAASTNIKDAIDHSNVFMILVATPSLPDGNYDHSQVDSVVEELIKYGGQKDSDVIIGCTVMPGYCDTVAEKLRPYGYRVSYNPEFIAQGSIIINQQNPDMILIGEANESSGDLVEDINMAMCVNKDVKICRMTRKEAELTKLSLNCFLTTKIAYANMIGDIAIASRCRPDVILDAIGKDSRIGPKYLKYGFGFGGPCFSRDNKALGIFANDLGQKAIISESSDYANKYHLSLSLAQFSIDHPDKNEELIFESITYKPNSVLIVESQQLQFVHELIHLYKYTNIKIKESRKEVLDALEKDYPEIRKVCI